MTNEKNNDQGNVSQEDRSDRGNYQDSDNYENKSYIITSDLPDIPPAEENDDG